MGLIRSFRVSKIIIWNELILNATTAQNWASAYGILWNAGIVCGMATFHGNAQFIKNQETPVVLLASRNLKFRQHYVQRSGLISINPNFGVNRSIWGILGNIHTDRHTDTHTDRSSFYIQGGSVGFSRGGKYYFHLWYKYPKSLKILHII